MSSGAIHGQIIACQNRIDEVKAEIRRLETLVANQESAIRQYAGQKQKYQDRMQTNEKIFNNISTYKAVSVFAEKYEERMSKDISKSTQSNMYDQIDDVENLMKKERDQTQEELEEARRELTNLQNSLTQLQVEYENAVRAEREAAEAAAAAEAAKGKGKR